jgi:predicted amidohydrolase
MYPINPSKHMTLTMTNSEIHAMLNLIDRGLQDSEEILGYPDDFSKTAITFAKENRQVLQGLKLKMEA